jgi:tetratricopeptide (TPR) repeat protein
MPDEKDDLPKNKFEDWLDRLRRMAVNIAVVIATVLVVGMIVAQVFSGSYLIEPLNISKNLSDKIPDEAGLAAELRDEVGAAWHRAFSETAIKPVVQESDQPDVKVGETELPVRYIAQLIRDISGYPIVRVSGHVLPPPPDKAASKTTDEQDGTLVRITLTTTSRASGPFFDESGRYPEIVRKAAVQTLAQIDPFAAAWALTQGNAEDRQHALTLAKSALKDSRSREWPTWVYRFLGIKSDVPRGELAVGSALFSIGDDEQAREHFKAANEEYALREGSGKRWYAADDGIATTFIREKRFNDARAAVRNALEDRPDYDSAKYHLAEITDNEARAFYRGERNVSLTFCQAEQLVKRAKAEYTELLADHPLFAIAYTQEGTLLLIRLNWIRQQHPIPSCEGGYANAGDLDTQLKEARNLLTTATVEDSGNPQSWFQLANLLYEMQDPLFSGSSKDSRVRADLLEEAEGNYRQSISLLPDDFYIWYRFGQTLSAHALLNPEAADQLKREAISAFCRALALNKNDQTMIQTIKNALDTDHPGTSTTCSASANPGISPVSGTTR